MDAATRDKEIKAYILLCVNKAEQYKKDIESGKQISNKWIKLAVDRSRADEKRRDIFFDKKAVERVFEFFYFTKISNGEKYSRFNLAPYQAWILSEIFGWFYTGKERKRRFRYSLLYTARKSGKTVFFVVVEFLILIYDYQQAPEAYLCATTREQAGQALKYSKEIIKESKSLRARLKTQQFQILYPKRSGIMKVLANKPERNDSLNPSIFIMDEMHAHPTLDFFNVMKSGNIFRRNPLGIITSTAGFNKEYPFYTMLETAKRVLQGQVKNDIYFYALYCLDDEDEIEDFEKWIKANPNIGQTIQLNDLILEYRAACLTISEKNNFITKNLNRYLDNLDRWIPDDVYLTCFQSMPIPPGRVKAYIGLDLSATRDLASMVLIFTDPVSGKIGVIPEFYFPQNEVKRIRKSGIDLGAWIEKGFIIEHQTPTIDQEAILDRIKYYNTIFEIVQINYDKWNSGYIIPSVERELFIYCAHFQQQTTWFNFPLKYIEKLFFDKNICMSENPCMRWQFSNIVLYYDGNGNIKIMKNKSKDSVDGPVSLGMAIGAWLENNGDTVLSFFKEMMQQARENQNART